VIVVGAGHNGLTAAAYSRAPGAVCSSLRRAIASAAHGTLEHPFDDPGFVVSPCAYLVGLLHHRSSTSSTCAVTAIAFTSVDPHLWCPFDDGTALSLWDDSERKPSRCGRDEPR